jgi:hypothetical protein
MPAWLLAVPVLVKLLAVLGLLLLVHRLVRNLALAAAVGVLALGLWFGHGWSAGGASPGLPRLAAGYLLAADTWSMGIAVLLAIWLSGLMECSGAMADLVAVVRRRCPRRAAMAVLPAVIGWLPMPGGANFSAPLVDACDERRSVEPLTKALVNYWFRHIWEYWWPLYPGVLLATRLSGLEAPVYMTLMAPLSLVAMGAGWALLLRRVPCDVAEDRPALDRGWSADLGRFIVLIVPILAVVAAYVALRLLLPAWTTGAWRYLPVIVGVVLAIILVSWQRRLTGAHWRAVVGSRTTAGQVLLVFLLCGFGALIEAPLPDGRLPAEVLRGELAAWAIPSAVIMALIPFLVALVTGISVAFVGAGFPIVMGLLGPAPAPSAVLAATMLAFGAGYAGLILSPVHFCLIQTNLYFATSLGASLRRLLPPVLLVFAMAVAGWAVLRWGPWSA